MKVSELREMDFKRLTIEKKMEIKTAGRPTPDLNICFLQKQGQSRTPYFRRFDRKMYDRAPWICGCQESDAFYCFVCLLYGYDKTWTEEGMRDIKRLKSKIHSHENSAVHKNHFIDFQLLGRQNLNAPTLTGVDNKGKESALKNKKILSSVIDVLKLCAWCDLPLGGREDSNEGSFAELVRYSRKIDAVLDSHMSAESAFDGTARNVRTELLRCMLEVCRDRIREDVDSTSFVSLMVDDMSDVSAGTRMSLVLRYELRGRVHERFWGYVTPATLNADGLATSIFQKIDPLLERDPQKLIAQTYDGVHVPSSDGSVYVKVQEKYRNAHYFYCYTHPISKLVEQVAGNTASARVFFANVNGIASFFAKSVDRRLALKHVCDRTKPKTYIPGWDLRTRPFNLVAQYQDCILACFEHILWGDCRVKFGFDAETIQQASAFAKAMVDSTFMFWLGFFSDVMTHADALFVRLHIMETDPSEIPAAIDTLFEEAILDIRGRLQPETDQEVLVKTEDGAKPAKKRRPEDVNNRHAMEVCDALVFQVRERFAFRHHLFGAKLFKQSLVQKNCRTLPGDDVKQFCAAFPVIEPEPLKTELEVFYSRDEIRSNVRSSCLKTLNFIHSIGVEFAFGEIVKSLRILLTLPMNSFEEDRCLYTVKSVKSYLKRNPNADCLGALTMLFVERAIVEDMLDFNEKVIEKFAANKERRKELSL